MTEPTRSTTPSALPEGPGQELIAFLHRLTMADLPADVVDRAKVCLLEALGCGIFGASQPWTKILTAETVAEGNFGQCTALGIDRTLSAPAAALINGTAIHGFELDDLIAESITHPAACVIPAALAAAEKIGATGAQLIEAIVAGYEAMHRIGVGLGTEPAKKGFHTTSLVAPIACAVAAGKIFGLTLDQLYSAVGLACSAAAGIKSFAAGRGGGMVKRLHLGRSAEAGVRSAALAARGFLGPPFAIDSKFGMLEVYGGAGAMPHRLSRRLGQDWAVRDVWFKVYPICGWIQTAVMLLGELRGPRRFTLDDVKAVHVGVSDYAARNNGEPAPIDTMGAQYSIPFCAATALLGEPRDPRSFLVDAVTDPTMRAMAAKVAVYVDADMEAVYPAKFAARVRLELSDGSVLERVAMECHGTPVDPCTRQEHIDKFRWLSGQILTDAAVRAVVQSIDNIATAGDVRELMHNLRFSTLAHMDSAQ